MFTKTMSIPYCTVVIDVQITLAWMVKEHVFAWPDELIGRKLGESTKLFLGSKMSYSPQ